MAKTGEEYRKGIEKTLWIGSVEALKDGLEMCRALERCDSILVDSRRERYQDAGADPTIVYDEDNFNDAHALGRQIRQKANALVKRGVGQDALDLYYDCHLFDAPYVFDSFCIYIEKRRDPQKKFYIPRRKQLLELTQALQDLEDGKIYLLGISLPPGVGKTTLAEFFLAWTSGRHPELPNLIGSHSFPFVDGMYGEMLRIFDPLGEYCYQDVFPDVRVIKTSSRMRMIDLGSTKKDGKRFMTLEFGTLGASLAGRVRAMNLLYCDDLVPSIETALNRDRLDKLWQQYYTDFRQRKIGNRCKELHIATRWAISDVLGRLEQEYGDDEYARFISVPALDDNDESNFDYPYGLGYTTEDLHKQRDIMDEASFRALFMNEPIERQGVLFEPSELRGYFSLPDRDPDAVLALVDSKEQGSDYAVMVVAYQYGQDFYVEHFVCDNGKVEFITSKMAQVLYDYKVNMCQVESNRGGTLFAQEIQSKLEDLGGHTTITTKWTQSNKETRIEVNSMLVKKHFLFKDQSVHQTDKEYRTAMNFLYSYTMMGKNKYDDVPDAMSLFVEYALVNRRSSVKIMKRPF